MDKISNEQKRLLENIKHRTRLVPSFVVEFYEFLRRKSQDEPLDPQWAEWWRRIKDRAADYVGARASEAIDTAISTINPIDPEVWSLRLSESQRLTILLGAGASAPPPSSIPTVSNLLPELWRRARKIGRDDLDRLEAWCNSKGIRNIEDLLTAAYIANFAAKNSAITALLEYFLFSTRRDEEEDLWVSRVGVRRRSAPEVDASSIALFQDTLQTLFGLLTSTMIMAKPNPAHSAISRFLSTRPKTTLITTNYDGCMDEALLAAGRSIQGISGVGSGQRPEEVDLIKMHGSINWSYCDSCQEVREFPLLEMKRSFEEDRLSYAVIGICKTCGGQRRPLLVPPLSFKFMMFPNLVSLWNSARRAIEAADILLVVGYSFSEADTYITRMISRTMALNPLKKLIIVDTNYGLTPAIRERFLAHIEDFDARRILQMVGSCDVILPELLNSLLGQRAANGREPSEPKPEAAPSPVTVTGSQ